MILLIVLKLPYLAACIHSETETETSCGVFPAAEKSDAANEGR